MNLDFVNILILYFLAIRVHIMHILHCTLHAVFPTFLFFKLESCNLVCRREFRFCKHFYTLFFYKQGVHSAPEYDQSWCFITPLQICLPVPINTMAEDSSSLSWWLHVKRSIPMSHARNLETLRFLVLVPLIVHVIDFYANGLKILVASHRHAFWF